MSHRLAHRLLHARLVTQAALDAALVEWANGGRPLLRALVESGALTLAALETELVRAPMETTDAVDPDLALLARLPPRLTSRLLAVPLDQDPVSGEVRLAVADPWDDHAAREVGWYLGATVRAVRAPLDLLDAALSRVQTARGKRASAPPPKDAPPSTQRGGQLDVRALLLGTRVKSPEAAFTGPEVTTAKLVTPEPVVAHAASPDVIRSSRPPPRGSRRPMAAVPDPGAFFARIAEASRATEVLAALLEGAGTVATRVALLVPFADAWCGWACNDAFGPGDALASVRIAKDALGPLAHADETGIFLGALPGDDAHAALAELVGPEGTELTIVRVPQGAATAALVLAVELRDLLSSASHLERLAWAAGERMDALAG